MNNRSSWSNTPLSGAPVSSVMGENPTFLATEQGFGKGGVYKLYILRSGLYGGKIANQDPKAQRAASFHMGLIGLLIGGMMAKKATQKMVEKEAAYNSISPEDSQFMTLDKGNFYLQPSQITQINVKSKLGLAGWGSDYDCSFEVMMADGKKRKFFVKKGLGGDALKNLLRAISNNVQGD